MAHCAGTSQETSSCDKERRKLLAESTKGEEISCYKGEGNDESYEGEEKNCDEGYEGEEKNCDEDHEDEEKNCDEGHESEKDDQKVEIEIAFVQDWSDEEKNNRNVMQIWPCLF